MDSLQQAMFVIMLLFWIPSVSYILFKYFEIKKSVIVIGKIVNIEPVYRGARYTFEVQFNGTTETKTISPNTAFQQYRLNEEIELYRYEKDGYISYSVKGSNYTVPLVAMAFSLFFFLVSIGA